MLIVTYVSLGILIVLIGAQFIRRPLLVQISRPAFYFSIIALLLLLSYQTRAQFLAWYNAGPPARYLVPPYQGIEYFIFYTFTRFWFKYLLSLVIAIIALWAARYFNKRHNEKFFYPEEPYLLATSILLVSHPLWLGYLILVFALYLLFTIIFFKQRVSFYYFWLPVAIAIIAATPYLRTLSLFTALKI